MTTSVKGWCPGALRPMMSGDGLLVRLRPRCGTLRADIARQIADCAELLGNGLIELTSRANLQVRGVREDDLPALQERLAGLGLLDPDAGTEALRNIIASPLAGVDPLAVLDIRPVVAALEEALAADGRLAGLPGKFGFVVEDGGTFDLARVEADVAFRAVGSKQAPWFAVWLAGQAEPLGVCATGEVPAVAISIAMEFLRLCATLDPPPRRMRDTGAWASSPPSQDTGARASSPPLPPLQRYSYSGSHEVPDQRAGSPRSCEDGCLGHHGAYLGIGKPFGRWRAGEFRALADRLLADAGPDAELRLTPWRHVLLPGCGPDAANLASAFGGIVDPADPRLAVVACPGAPACASGSSPTLQDALALADIARKLQPSGIALHVSGCGKSCARREKTRVTLVGREGLYDLVLDGSATNRASLTGLDVSAARAALEALAQGALLGESVL